MLLPPLLHIAAFGKQLYPFGEPQHAARTQAPPVWPADAINADECHRLSMRWYTLGQTIFGYAPGTGLRGCYIVPVIALFSLG